MRSSLDLFKLIGINMKKIRKEKIGLSQEKLADELNMSRSLFAKIESKKMDMGVSIDTLFYMSQKYNFDIREFFEGYEELMDSTDKRS